VVQRQGRTNHSITDANGMPVVAITTPANGDERQQVLTMLAQIRLAIA